MKHHIRILSVGLFALATGLLSAQTAYRCESNGQTVYSDKPCVNGASKVVAQETPEQRARSEAAAKQLKADSAEVDKKIADRQAIEAKERAEARKTQQAAAKQEARDAAAAKKAAKKPAKAKAAEKKTRKTKASQRKKDQRAAKPS